MEKLCTCCGQSFRPAFVYQVAVIGRLESVVEEFYAVSPERKIKHPAVAAISEAARSTLFAS